MRRSKKMKILRDYFSNYLSTDSLFTKMSTLGAPWSSEVGQDMDDAYFTMYSGIKNPSQFVTLHMLDDSVNSLTIARILLGIYGESWTRLWDAYKTKYSPIENYSIVEHTVHSQNDDRTIGKDSTTDTSDTSSGSTNYGERIDTTANAKTYQYGFNSSTGAPTTEVDETGTEDHSGTDTTTSSDTGKTTFNENTTDNLDSKSDTERTRSGLIGQNTFQELIKQEFELWRWNFYLHVFEDVDKFLVLSTVDPCSVE